MELSMFDLAGILDGFPCRFSRTIGYAFVVEFAGISACMRRGGYEGTSEDSVCFHNPIGIKWYLFYPLAGAGHEIGHHARLRLRS